MATIRQIKEKQKSIKSINKITKAMQLVSTAKSKKSINALREYENYVKDIYKFAFEISKDAKLKEKFQGTLWIVILSDLGLAGSYNSSVTKLINENLKKEDKLIVIGNKGISIVKKHSNAEYFSEHKFLDENVIEQVVSSIKIAYHTENLNVKIIFTEFVNQIKFNPVIRDILPFNIDFIKERLGDYKSSDKIINFEPNKEELIYELEDLYLSSSIIHCYKESKASEDSSRRIAMEAATNNGLDLLDNLNIQFNRTRQAKITQEISEIIGGAESLK